MITSLGQLPQNATVGSRTSAAVDVAHLLATPAERAGAATQTAARRASIRLARLLDKFVQDRVVASTVASRHGSSRGPFPRPPRTPALEVTSPGNPGESECSPLRLGHFRGCAREYLISPLIGRRVFA